MKAIRTPDGFRVEEAPDYMGRMREFRPISSDEWKRWLYQTYQNFPLCLSGCKNDVRRSAARSIAVENLPGESQLPAVVLDTACRITILRFKHIDQTFYFEGRIAR